MAHNKRLGRRLTLHFALIQICFNMAFCAVMNFASVYLLARGFTNTQLGMTITCGNIIAVSLQSFIASRIDKSPRVTTRGVITVLAALTSLCLVGVLLAPSIVPVIALFYVGTAGTMMLQHSMLNTLAMEAVSQGIPLNYSLARGTGSACFSAISFTMGFLIQRVGSFVSIPIALAVTLLEVFIVFSFKYPQPAAARQQELEKARQAVGFVDFVRRNPRFMCTMLGLVFIFYAHMLTNTYILQVLLFHGGSSGDLGIANGIAAMVELPAMLLFPFLLRRVKSAASIMRFTVCFFFLKSMCTLLAPSVGWVFAAQALQFFAFGLYTPASVYFAREVIAEADLAKGQTSVMMCQMSGTLLSSFTGGMMLDSAGGAPFMLRVGTTVSGIGMCIVLVALAGGFRAKSGGRVQSDAAR